MRGGASKKTEPDKAWTINPRPAVKLTHEGNSIILTFNLSALSVGDDITQKLYVKNVDDEIQEAIDEYVCARKRVLAIGRECPERIGGNDNIIGRIGEFIAIRFLESRGQKPSKAEGLSNPGYDLIDGDLLTQVKVISFENVAGRNVRLTKPWTQFLLVELGEDYTPTRIGMLTEAQHQAARQEHPTWSETPVVKRTMLSANGLIGRHGEVVTENQIGI